MVTEMASKVATASDEALLLWWIALNSEKWNKMLDAKNHAVPIKDPPTKKGNNKVLMTQRLTLCYEMNNRTSAVRKEPRTGEGWDGPLLVEAKRHQGEGNKSHKGNRAASIRHATYVLCYSGPDQEPLLARKDEPVPFEV